MWYHVPHYLQILLWPSFGTLFFCSFFISSLILCYISANFIVNLFSISCLKTLEHIRCHRTSSHGTSGSPDCLSSCWGWLLALKESSLGKYVLLLSSKFPRLASGGTFSSRILPVLRHVPCAYVCWVEHNFLLVLVLPRNLPDDVVSKVVSLLKPVCWPCMAQVAPLQLNLLVLLQEGAL